MPSDLFSLSDPLLRQVVRHASAKTLRARLNAAADSMGEAAFKARMAREIVRRTRPQAAIPETVAHYRALVCDGLEYYLSQVSRPRLLGLVLAQIRMDPDAAPEARLLELAKRFPTLHKLGQVIARHPHLDPIVKRWLIQLENGRYGTPAAGLVARIRSQVRQSPEPSAVRLVPTVLSEASVGAVLRFDWYPPDRPAPIRGVFKLLKPGIRRHVIEELDLLEKTAAFIEANRALYPLARLRFLEIFQDVREMLIKEIDLGAEQRHLDEAVRFYAGVSSIRIPRRLPFGGPAMTAMQYLTGPKITDAALSPAQRRRCAGLLFEALVCRPLFSERESALFHGDPHAGNILALGDLAFGSPAIGLLDWSLAGHLKKSDRIKTVQVIQAIVRSDLDGICDGVRDLVGQRSSGDHDQRHRLRRRVAAWLQSDGCAHAPLVKKCFGLMAELAYEGYAFPADLMLFRKAIFTLEGVLLDLWPEFDMDTVVMGHLAQMLARELPLRINNLFFPLSDRPEGYPSLISNSALVALITHHHSHAIQSGTQVFIDAAAGWGRLLGVLDGPAGAVAIPGRGEPKRPASCKGEQWS